MYKRHCILIIFSLFLLSGLSGQQVTSFPEVDAATYRYYLSQEWDSIIYINKLARKNSISYYHLDLRVGIARYEKNQYRQSIPYFRKAISENSGEDMPKEYQFYAYQLSGQRDRADLLSKHFKAPLSDRIPPSKPKFLKSVSLETVYHQTNGDKLKDELWGESSDGFRTITNNMLFFQLGMVHQPAAGFTIHQGISYLHKNNSSYIQSEASEVFFPDQNMNQLDYFIIPKISLKTGLSLSPSFHYARMSNEVLESVTFGFGMRPNANINVVTEQFILGGFELKQSVWLLDLSVAGSYLSVNGKSDYQQQIGFIFYPLGNLNLYMGADYYITDDHLNNAILEENVWHAIIGWTIKEKIWIEASYTDGNMIDFRENNNMIFYNSIDFLNRKAKLHFIVPRQEGKGSVYFGTRWASHMAPYYLTTEERFDMENSVEYKGLTFYLGISWNI